MSKSAVLIKSDVVAQRQGYTTQVTLRSGEVIPCAKVIMTDTPDLHTNQSSNSLVYAAADIQSQGPTTTYVRRKRLALTR